MTHRVYWFLQEYEGGYVKFGLLRSVDWLYNLGIDKVGDTATFAMEEFGVVGDAQLMQIDRCPEIEMGAGRICTGWFEHSAGQLWELYIEGSSTPIRGTDRHPIWSNDRLAWVPLSELQEGESVQVQGGYAKVQHLQETEEVEKEGSSGFLWVVYSVQMNTKIALGLSSCAISTSSENSSHSLDRATKIVFDRFHIMQHVVEAVDAVRKAEHRRLLADGDESLKRTKYLWLFSEENLPEEHAQRFAQLKQLHLQTGRAWAMKESLRDLWNYQRPAWALKHWKAWYFWATLSRLAPVIRAARMIKNHLANVLTYFKHRIRNATSEGLNSKIQTIKKMRSDFAIGSISRLPSTFTLAA